MGDKLEKAGIEKQSFLSKYGIPVEQFRATGLEWSELVAICEHHAAMEPELQPIGAYVSECLRMVPEVHSLRRRVKDCEHLVEKIIRKKREDPSLEFNTSSYEKLVTDLIGVRAIHLFKDQWQAIHQVVKERWDLEGNAVAYVREGDPPQLQDSFREAGCDVKEHDFGYRSVHYLIKFPAKRTRLVELQVRTIFEEGWSEIDHLVRYRRKSGDPNLEVFLQIFNRLAGSADEMGTFTKVLDTLVRSHALKAKEKEAEINAVISQLTITREEKLSLEKKVTELQGWSHAFATTISNVNMPNLAIEPATVFFSSSPIIVGRGDVLTFEKVCAGCGKTFSDTTLQIGDPPRYCPQCAAARQS
jgi:ppGpp synthetase/RelA/SpoT-type nucleotidyltranferase